ncbi:MAG: hypothetical protein U0353_25220 [Sandaracinus sp.]
MSLEAIALLRLPEHAAGPGVVHLSDAVLLSTGASFASEPEELALGLRRLLGEALDRHDDARGVFFVPAVALEPARAAGSYAAAIEAIGEAGMWVALLEEGSTARPTMVEALMMRAMDGEEVDPEALQGAMRASLAQMSEAFAAGAHDDELEGEGTSPGTHPPLDLAALLSDPAMMALAQKMRDLMPPSGADDAVDDDDEADYEDDGEEPTDGVGTELDGAMPMDLQALMGSPAFAELLRNAQDVLAKNPEEAQRIAARLGLGLGAAPHDDEE